MEKKKKKKILAYSLIDLCELQPMIQHESSHR